MSSPFTKKDLQQFASMGITAETVEKQIENFRKGFPKTCLSEAATVENKGILRIGDEEINQYVKAYQELSQNKKILKFVPASGAATRMFKDLYAFSSTYFGVDNNFENEFPSVKEFIQIRLF